MKIKRSEFIEKWLEALESGEYKQTTGVLRREGDGNEEFRYCCLGVACEVANKFSKEDYFELSNGSVLPISLARFIGISEDGGFKNVVHHGGKSFMRLTYMNDSGVRFKTIARIIREQFAAGNFEKP